MSELDLDAIKAPPATDELLQQFVDLIEDVRTHEHPKPGQGEDFYCTNLRCYMGERMAFVLARLRDEMAEVERLREFVQSVPISALDFSARVYNALMRAGHRTVGELVKLNGHDLLDYRGFGVTSLAEVIDRLGEHGLKLQEPPCPLPELPAHCALDGGER